MPNVAAGPTGNDTSRQRQREQVYALRYSATDALTALAGGGQTGATLNQYGTNRYTTVATAADSSIMPPAKAGDIIIVINAAAANSMNVFPASGEKFNALSGDAAFALASNKTAIFICAVDGTWNTVLTA